MSLDDVARPRSVSQLRSRSKIRSRRRSDTSMIMPGRRRTRGSLQVTSSGLLLEPHRQLCDETGVWLHVDGAYGAPAILDPRYTDQLAPLADADSVALDAHKWLYVPYDAGAVLIRDPALMRATFSRVAAYVAATGDPNGVTLLPWFSEYGLEQTRPFRALKIWAALRHHGRDGYARSIARDNRLADHLARLADRADELELVAHNLSIVCLRYRPAERLDDDQLDELNHRVLTAVQLSGQAFLSGTELDGRFVLRACFINPRTTGADVQLIADTVIAAGQACLASGAPPAPLTDPPPVRKARAAGARYATVGAGRTKPASSLPISMWAVWVVTTGSLAANERNFSSSSASTTPRPQEPVPSSTGPKITICPESIHGCQ
jgi:pyridoxal-dependent decarboxylase-like protein